VAEQFARFDEAADGELAEKMLEAPTWTPAALTSAGLASSFTGGET